MASSKKVWRRRVGRVTVYQRGGRFWIYYRDYKPVRRPVGTSRDEALAVAAKINAQLADDVPTMPAFQPIAVTAMIAKWLDHHEHVRRSAVNTVNRYRAAIAEAEQQMDDELEKDRGRPEDLACREVSETGPQAGCEIQDGEELLKQDESRAGRDRLVLELQCGNGVGLTSDAGSAKLHEADLLVVLVLLILYTHDGA